MSKKMKICSVLAFIMIACSVFFSAFDCIKVLTIRGNGEISTRETCNFFWVALITGAIQGVSIIYRKHIIAFLGAVAGNIFVWFGVYGAMLAVRIENSIRIIPPPIPIDNADYVFQEFSETQECIITVYGYGLLFIATGLLLLQGILLVLSIIEKRRNS